MQIDRNLANSASEYTGKITSQVKLIFSYYKKANLTKNNVQLTNTPELTSSDVNYLTLV